MQTAIDRLGGVHNIHLSRLWSSRRCLHLEGKDICILKVLQDTLFPKSDQPFDIIPHLSIGGWTGWNQAIGSAKAMKNAAGEDIITYCILDSDYHTEEDICNRYNQAKQNNLNLHIWTRKEIENYLLVPSGIARLIAGLTGNSVKVSAMDVTRQMDVLADQMKNDILDALSQEYYNINRAGGVKQANSKARMRLDKAWKTRPGRMSVISGKEAISRLSKWAQDTFNVSFGALKVARILNQDEIPKEIQKVIEAIERSKKFPVKQND